jgi:hypothetical protein
MPSLQCQLRPKEKADLELHFSKDPTPTTTVHYYTIPLPCVPTIIRDSGTFSLCQGSDKPPTALPLPVFPRIPPLPFPSPSSILTRLRVCVRGLTPCAKKPGPCACECWMSRLRLLQCTDARRAPLSRTKIPRSPEPQTTMAPTPLTRNRDPR